MKVIIYEFVSGGGYAEQSIPQGVLSEGFGMLRSIAADFKSAGQKVTLLLDERISKLNPSLDVDCTVPILYAKEPESFLHSIAKINDAVYIIAPETDGILQSLVGFVETTGKVSLNCKSEAIGKVADKVALNEILNKFETAPRTIVLGTTDNLAKLKQAIKSALDYPIILKPADGVSCGGLSLVNDETQVEKAVEKIRDGSKNENFVAQEFVDGEHVSVSLLSNGVKAVAISLNKQNVTLSGAGGVSSYDGGSVPFEHPLKQEAFRVAEKLVEAISGLRGYVGVDLILAREKPFVVDVNPRLTTSYVGLRRVAGFNVAEAMVNTILKSSLPPKRETTGYTSFVKIETKKPSVEAFVKAAKLASVVSPPFLLNDDTKVSSLLIGEGESVDDSRLQLEEAKKRLLNITG